MHFAHARAVECVKLGLPAHRTKPVQRAPQQATSSGSGTGGSASEASTTARGKYAWSFDAGVPPPWANDPKVRAIPLEQIRRPLGRTRANDAAKVEALMASIADIGLQEPIDVLEVDGQIYGFSGCHRFEAHQRLEMPTILCRVRRANKQVLMMHLR